MKLKGEKKGGGLGKGGSGMVLEIYHPGEVRYNTPGSYSQMPLKGFVTLGLKPNSAGW